jgi:hypothetical protein
MRRLSGPLILTEDRNNSALGLGQCDPTLNANARLEWGTRQSVMVETLASRPDKVRTGSPNLC